MRKIKELCSKINITNLLLMFLIIQPFLDIYLKVVGERLDILGFSLATLFRIGFVIVALIYILIKRKSKKDIIVVGTYLLLVAIYSVIHIYNGQKFYNYFALGEGKGVFTELLYILRLTLPIMLLYCVYKEGVNIKKITKYLSLTAILISTVIVITDIFKISFIAYSLKYEIVKDNIFSWFTDGYEKYYYSELTAKGWFYEGNSISALLVFTFPILLYNAMKHKKWYCYVGIFIQIIAMLMLGSRTASYGWILVYIGYILFYLVFNAVKKRKYDYKFIFSSIAIIIISIGILQYSPIEMRMKYTEQYKKQYNQSKGEVKKEYNGIPIDKLEHDIIYNGENVLKYVDAVNKGLIDVSDKYSHAEVQKMVNNNELDALRDYIEKEYIYMNYVGNYINAFYVREVLPYNEDPEFWLEVLKMPFEKKSDNREMEKIIIKRLKENNDNFIMDTLFGLNDTALKSRGYVVETDFYSHYYTIGILGIIILFGPYIFVLAYCGIRILWDLKKKFTMGNVMYSLSLISALGMGYLSGHLMDEYITSLIMIYILASLLLNVQENNSLEGV